MEFVRRFAGFVADETGQGDRGAFLARLSQQLALNILPSTREMQLEVLEALTGDLGVAGTATQAVSPGGMVRHAAQQRR